MLEAISEAARPKRKKGSLGGSAALGLPDAAAELSGRGKWIREKAVIAAVIRHRTGVRNLWIARRLEMGHEGGVTRAVRWMREDSEGRKLGESLEAMLDYRDWPIDVIRENPIDAATEFF